MLRLAMKTLADQKRALSWWSVGLFAYAILIVVTFSRSQQSLIRILSFWFSPKSAEILILVCRLVFTTAGPLLAGLLARDLDLRLLLRQAVRMQIKRVRCRSCKYLLIGQRVTAGLVTCPECGEQITLALLGVTAEDLVPPEAGEDRLADIPDA